VSTGRDAARARVPGVALALVLIGLAGWLRRDPTSGWIGLTLAPAGPGAGPAVRVTAVMADSPAERAGVRAGDVVRAAAGRQIATPRELTHTVRHQTPGTSVSLALERDGAALAPTLAVAARPPDLACRLEQDRDAWQEPERVLDLLAIAAGGSVADLGAGGGYFSERLAARVGAAGRVLAIDIDPDARQQLASRFPAARFPQIAVRAGRARDPGLPAASVDAVLMVDVYHELEDGPGMLAALRRALRPGGRVVIVDRAAAEFDPAAHAIPETRVVADAAAAGLRVRERVDLPRQFAIVLE
jgi:predicted methyltransferase